MRRSGRKENDSDKIEFVRSYFGGIARRAWAKVPKNKRQEHARRASIAFWSSMTPDERSAEMMRRAKVRARNRRRRLKRPKGG